ncbi:MAG: tetratricopeptide repeat protein [Prevotella sp.]|nr:tetratricopeptide repeat protein [Prevotella sp.]
MMRKRLILLTGCLLMMLTAFADNSKATQLYEAADEAYAQQDYKKAATIAKEALPLCKGTELEADCLSLLAIIHARLSDYDEAARYAKECYALDEKTGDPDVMSSSLNTLAGIYMGANQPKEAETYILRGIELAEKANNPSRMSVLQAMASEVYHALGDDQKALPYIEKAYEIDKQAGNEPRAKVRLAQKASILIGLHQYQEAEKVLNEVIPFLRQTPDRQSLGIACNKMGMALLSQQREAEALPYYQEAADIFMQLGDPYNEVHARRGLYEALWKSNPDEAKHQLDRFNDLKDSIYSKTSAETLARYNAEFGNNWLQIENHEQRRDKLWAIMIAIALALLAVGIWWMMRRRQQRQAHINQELQEHIHDLQEKYNVLNEHYGNAIATSTKEDTDELNATDRDFLENTVNIINELILTGQIDANHVADRLGMSLFQFRQRLTALTEETPQSFIQNVRMRRARHLLDNHPEMNISEIATLCAYNDTPNFTRAFKKNFGVTPTQYLERKE